MNAEIVGELDRLREVMAGLGFGLPLSAPASRRSIASIERETGIRFDPDLVEFYRRTNGSARGRWLAVFTDELTPCDFPSIEECYAWWREWLPYDSRVHSAFGPGEPGRDPRIQPDYSVHRLWFPIAEFNGWGTTVFFDADPTPSGKRGQIIAYQHDPDAVYYIAPDFLSFLRGSNELMARHGRRILFVDGRPTCRLPPLGQ